ncbi:MAG: PT domain-containing protein [Legionellaceae bacterium]|nr:PT domain-containing protein [Legionellaceae bacterium]
MSFDKRSGKLIPYYVPFTINAAVSEGNSLYIAGKSHLATFDFEHKTLSWGRQFTSPLYTIIDLNLYNGHLRAIIRNHNIQHVSSVLIEEYDMLSGHTLSNASYNAAGFSALPLKGTATLNGNTYIITQAEYLNLLMNIATEEAYILSAISPMPNDVDRPLAISVGYNSLYLLTSSIRNANFYYNLVKFNTIDNRLSVDDEWPIRTDEMLSDIASVHIDEHDYLVTCGQSAGEAFFIKLDEQGHPISTLGITYSERGLTCTSLVKTSGGIIATVQYYEDSYPVIFTLFIDQYTFEPTTALPIDVTWHQNTHVLFDESDLTLQSLSLKQTSQPTPSYISFSANMTLATDFIQFGLPKPSAPPSFRPSTKPSSPSPSSSKPSFRPSTATPTLFGFTYKPTQTDNPSRQPTGRPTYLRSNPTGEPTQNPITNRPTGKPISNTPTVSETSIYPTQSPTAVKKPSPMPTLAKDDGAPKNTAHRFFSRWNPLYYSLVLATAAASCVYACCCSSCRKYRVTPRPRPPAFSEITAIEAKVIREVSQQMLSHTMKTATQVALENILLNVLIDHLMEKEITLSLQAELENPLYESEDIAHQSNNLTYTVTECDTNTVSNGIIVDHIAPISEEASIEDLMEQGEIYHGRVTHENISNSNDSDSSDDESEDAPMSQYSSSSSKEYSSYSMSSLDSYLSPQEYRSLHGPNDSDSDDMSSVYIPEEMRNLSRPSNPPHASPAEQDAGKLSILSLFRSSSVRPQQAVQQGEIASITGKTSVHFGQVLPLNEGSTWNGL